MHHDAFCVVVPAGSFGACLDPSVTQANGSLKGRTKEERLSKLRQNYDPQQWIQGNQSAMFECLTHHQLGSFFAPRGLADCATVEINNLTISYFSICPIYPWIWVGWINPAKVLLLQSNPSAFSLTFSRLHPQRVTGRCKFRQFFKRGDEPMDLPAPKSVQHCTATRC